MQVDTVSERVFSVMGPSKPCGILPVDTRSTQFSHEPAYRASSGEDFSMAVMQSVPFLCETFRRETFGARGKRDDFGYAWTCQNECGEDCVLIWRQLEGKTRIGFMGCCHNSIWRGVHHTSKSGLACTSKSRRRLRTAQGPATRVSACPAFPGMATVEDQCQALPSRRSCVAPMRPQLRSMYTHTNSVVNYDNMRSSTPNLVAERTTCGTFIHCHQLPWMKRGLATSTPETQLVLSVP